MYLAHVGQQLESTRTSPWLMASEEVYRTLRYACSQNPDDLRAGEEQLKQWEQRSGYYAELAVRTVNLLLVFG